MTTSVYVSIQHGVAHVSRPNAMLCYEDGERTKFFRDDDDHSLQSLVEAEHSIA